jgi:predicted small lipoprotein YifL
MKTMLKLAACAAALVAMTACGEQRGPDGLSSEDDEKLNKMAEDLDVVDASPDSLVPEEGEAGNEVPATEGR